MATSLTGKVNGDGTFTLNVPDGGANPFAGTSMVPAGSAGIAAPSPTAGYRASVFGVEVMFATEADYLKADKAVREAMGRQNVPSVGGMPSIGGGGTGAGWLSTGAHAVEAVGGFLQRRNIRNKIDDMRDALDDQRAALTQLEQLASDATYSKLIPVLLRVLRAERDATESSVEYLEDQITAVDLATGAGVAKLANDFLSGNSSTGVGNIGPGVLAAGAGLAVGLAVSRDDDRSRRRRR
jgi:hypothetical protein